jgi:putative transcriptional regulator
MSIIVNLDVMMATRKMSINQLSEIVNITLANLSKLKTGKVKAIRFSTLEAVCKALDCQPGDLLEFVEISCVFLNLQTQCFHKRLNLLV